MRTLVIFILICLLGCKNNNPRTEVSALGESVSGWEYADSVLQNIQIAKIPSDTFHLDELTNPDLHLIQKAIDLVSENGGGTLMIKPGTYLTGPVVLKSKVNLHLMEGAEIKFNPDPDQYPLAYNWFNGIPCMNYTPFIYAQNQTDISISGSGVIDGQGYEHVWEQMKFQEKVDWELLRKMDKEGIDTEYRKFGKGHALRPDFMAFIGCDRVRISGVKFINAPYWTIHPVLCNDMIIENTAIASSGFDQIGIAVESCNNVLIDAMDCQSVGDGVKILAGRTDVPGIKPSQNVFIRNSKFSKIQYSPVIISSNTYAGANNIYISGLEVDSTEMVFRVYGGRYGKIKDVYLKDVVAEKVFGPVLYARISRADEGPAIISNIQLQDFEVKSSARAFVLSGHKRNRMEKIEIANSYFNTAKGSYAKNVKSFTLSNFIENGDGKNGTYEIGENKTPRIRLEGNEEEILDSDDIQIDAVPELVKESLEKGFSNTLITDIDRIITSDNVIYDINLQTASLKEFELLIQLDGKILREKSDVFYSELPDLVLSSLKEYINVDTNPFMMNEMKKVVYQDLTYYDLIGETRQKLFAASITEGGDRIEEKQGLITTSFSPDNLK